MTTPLIAEIARLRQADSVDAAARALTARNLRSAHRRGVALRPTIAAALRRLATQLDGKPAPTLVVR